MMIKNIELWEHALALLNDEVYLDLVRNFLGKVPTPFHKPLLNKRMTNLFSSEEFIERIEQSLSPIDRKILTSAFLLESPTQNELCSLFEKEVDYVALQQNVVNLEERLLLVPTPTQVKGELMQNPLKGAPPKALFARRAFSTSGEEEKHHIWQWTTLHCQRTSHPFLRPPHHPRAVHVPYKID